MAVGNDDIKLRTRDPRYLDAAKSYLKEVGRVLGPLADHAARRPHHHGARWRMNTVFLGKDALRGRTEKSLGGREL